MPLPARPTSFRLLVNAPTTARLKNGCQSARGRDVRHSTCAAASVQLRRLTAVVYVARRQTGPTPDLERFCLLRTASEPAAQCFDRESLVPDGKGITYPLARFPSITYQCGCASASRPGAKRRGSSHVARLEVDHEVPGRRG